MSVDGRAPPHPREGALLEIAVLSEQPNHAREPGDVANIAIALIQPSDAPLPMMSTSAQAERLGVSVDVLTTGRRRLAATALWASQWLRWQTERAIVSRVHRDGLLEYLELARHDETPIAATLSQGMVPVAQGEPLHIL